MRLALLRSFLSFLTISQEIPSVGDPEFVLEVYFSNSLTLRMWFVVVVVLWYLFKVEALIPSSFLNIFRLTLSLILVEMTIWFRDLLLDILVTESSDWLMLLIL